MQTFNDCSGTPRVRTVEHTKPTDSSTYNGSYSRAGSIGSTNARWFIHIPGQPRGTAPTLALGLQRLLEQAIQATHKACGVFQLPAFG